VDAMTVREGFFKELLVKFGGHLSKRNENFYRH
jgi:hypothetical protein